jgi:hypothetical protein
MFRSPERDGRGGLTQPILLSRPESSSVPARKPFDAMLFLPAFALMFCGIAGLLANSITAVRLFQDPVAMREVVQAQFAEARKFGLGADDPPEQRAQLDDQRADQTMRALQVVLPAFALLSGLVFLGGLSIALRWNHRLAQLGALAAIVNLPHLCCVPGAPAGLWALLMLGSREGREHFER